MPCYRANASGPTTAHGGADDAWFPPPACEGAERMKPESVNVREARNRRARRLADAMLEWQRLAEQKQYPRSLVDICLLALEHEYELGRKRERA